MLKRLRIMLLLYVLLFVAVGQYLAGTRSTDWDATLWVAVHPVDGDGLETTRARIASLDVTELEATERFFAAEAARYGVRLEQPVRFELARPSSVELPTLADDASFLDALLFSLRLRLAALRAGMRSDLPPSDITLFVSFHGGESAVNLDSSLGLRKGMVAVANVFSERSAWGSNQVVIAHELLHTLGATDKYEREGNMPLFPDGYADPAAKPLLPQRRAELMAGRIPIAEGEAEIPRGLAEVAIGPATAREIGWITE